MKNLILFVISLAFLLSCQSYESERPEFMHQGIDHQRDFIVFGRVYGWCSGACRRLYYLPSEEEAVYLNSATPSAHRHSSFMIEPLSSEFYQEAQNLRFTPSELSQISLDSTDLLEYVPDNSYYFYSLSEGVYTELQFDAIALTAPERLRSSCQQIMEVVRKLDTLQMIEKGDFQ